MRRSVFKVVIFLPLFLCGREKSVPCVPELESLTSTKRPSTHSFYMVATDIKDEKSLMLPDGTVIEAKDLIVNLDESVAEARKKQDLKRHKRSWLFRNEQLDPESNHSNEEEQEE